MNKREMEALVKEAKKLADEYGTLCSRHEFELDVHMNKFKAKFPEFDLIPEKKKRIEEIANLLHKAELPVDFDGEIYTVHLTPRKSETKIIDIPAKAKIKRWLGTETFNRLWTISITELRKQLAKKQQDEVLITDYKGARTVTYKEVEV